MCPGKEGALFTTIVAAAIIHTARHFLRRNNFTAG